MLTIHLLTMAKKRNSTLRPTDNGDGTYTGNGVGVATSCILRGPCSLVNPVFEFSRDRMGALHRYNYCFVPDFNRYYYIVDWAFDGPLMLARCKCDVMASFRNNIEGSVQYVIRSESTYNEYAIDTAYPATSDIDRRVEVLNNIPRMTSNRKDGTYALTVIGDSLSGSANPGATTTFLLDAAGVEAVTYHLYKDVSYMGITELEDAMVKALVDPLQYVVSLKYYPLLYTQLKSADILYNADSVDIKLGHWSLPRLEGARIALSNNNIYEFVVAQFDFKEHPQASQRGKFLNSPVYMKHTLTLPYYGDFDISPDYANEYDSFRVKMRVDLLTGDAYYHIELIGSGKTDHLTYIAINIGVDVIIAQRTQDVLGWASSAATGVLGIVGSAARGDVGGIFNSLVGGLESATRAQYPAVNSVGTNGSSIEASKKIIYSVDSFKITAACHQKFGRPLCELVNISNLSGYILCQNANVVSTGATAEELAELNEIMNTGFYYE